MWSGDTFLVATSLSPSGWLARVLPSLDLIHRGRGVMRTALFIFAIAMMSVCRKSSGFVSRPISQTTLRL